MPPKDSPPRAGATCALTLLATSDLHLNLCPWDHYSDRPAPGTGLISAAGRIARLRRTEPNALLLDNGDFLQGTAVGDAIADSHPPRADQPHPMIEAMNLLGYDAVALGNHDFDYGLEFLGAALAGAQFPALCANLVRTDGGPPPFGGWTVLERRVTDDAGKSWPLRIGLVGVLPPQVEAWGSAHLQGRAKAQGMVETVRRLVPRMIAAGADCPVDRAEDHGLDGDMIEAQAFAFLAVRVARLFVVSRRGAKIDRATALPVYTYSMLYLALLFLAMALDRAFVVPA